MLIPSPDVRFGPWAVEDEIVGPLVVTYVTADDEPVDLTGYAVTGAVANAPDLWPGLVLDGSVVGSSVEILFPGDAFSYAGIWRVDVALDDGAGNVFTPETYRFAVENRASGWLTLGEIRSSWRDAPRSDVYLYNLLTAARGQVEDYAQILDEPVVATSDLRLAQGLQAREIWNDAKRDPASQGFGDGDLLVRMPTLSPGIKDIIRHKKPKPVIA